MGVERVPADFRAERQQFALADARRADHRQIIAAPLVGHTNAQPAHADDILDVPIVALNADRRKDQRDVCRKDARAQNERIGRLPGG